MNGYLIFFEINGEKGNYISRNETKAKCAMNFFKKFHGKAAIINIIELGEISEDYIKEINDVNFKNVV